MSTNPNAVGFLPLTGGTLTGALTINPGNLTVFGSALVAGPVDVTNINRGLAVAEGANAKQGTATLVAGTVTVANTSVTAVSRIFLTSQVLGGTAGAINVTSRIAGTSFTVTSTNAADTSTFAYEMIEPG